MDLSYLQGEVLDGRFRLDALAGQGGFGAVFRGTQLSVDRTCAVKVVAPELATNETSLDRFRVEARATSRLSNPHTVVLFDFGRDPERSVLFLAMEWLDGGDLRDVVQRSGPLTFGATAKVVDQVAQSLSEAHQTGAVHRDIKPRNVMVVDRGGDELFTKVIDFGIAKAFAPEIWDGQTLTRTGRMVGTPSYMAPEQIRGSSVDSRTDQYAAAVLAHYLASGRKPVEGPGPMETVANQLREPPSPLSDHVSDLSAGSDLEAVLLKALSKDPAHRFGSIDAFSTAVSEAVASRSGRRERAAPTAEDRTPEPIEATGSSGRTTGAELAAVPASLLEPIDGGDSVADPTGDGEAAPPTAPTESERGPDPDEFATAAASDPPALPGTGNAPSAPAPGTAADGGGGGEVGRHSLAAVVGGMAFLGVIAGAAAHWLDRPRPANERAGASASLSGGGTDAGQTPADGSARAHAANAGETTAGTGRVESTLGGQPADAGREPKGDGSFRAVETGRRAGGATQRSDTAGEAGRADDGRSVGSTASPPKRRDERQAAGEAGGDEESPQPVSVVVVMRPWGRLFVDGRERATGGRATMTLQAGSHRIEVRKGGRTVVDRRVEVSARHDEFEFETVD